MRFVFLIARTVHGGLYRVSGGRIGAHVAGLPVLLLTTTGRQSGKRRTVPLGYYDDDGHALVVVGSKGGAPQHPAWYVNLIPHLASVYGEFEKRPVGDKRMADLK